MEIRTEQARPSDKPEHYPASISATPAPGIAYVFHQFMVEYTPDLES